jgi:hypothetical protein
MKNNQANVYLLDDQYTSIYVNLEGYQQMIFYWALATNKQKRKPKWRLTKQTIEEGIWIESYTDQGCILSVEGRRAEFKWGKLSPDNRPAYKGNLVNATDWPELSPEKPALTWASKRKLLTADQLGI